MNTPEIIQSSSAKYQRYLPKNFTPSLLGSWVSPSYINYTNSQFGGDVSTIRGRLKRSGLKTDFATTTQQAFHEKWFNWRLVNIGQIGKYGEIHTNNLPKILIIKFDISCFEGQSRYRRFLSLMAIIEYFYIKYEDLLRVVIIVFDKGQERSSMLYSNYSVNHKLHYFVAKAFSFIGALGAVNRILRLVK